LISTAPLRPLAVAASAYLAAVFFVWNRQRQTAARDFRRRAIAAGTATALLVGLTLLAARREAIGFSSVSSARGRFSPRARRVRASAWAVFTRRYRLARIFAAGEITLMLTAGPSPNTRSPLSLCHHQSSAAPLSMLRFMILATLAGLVPDPLAPAALPRFQIRPRCRLTHFSALPRYSTTGGLIFV